MNIQFINLKNTSNNKITVLIILSLEPLKYCKKLTMINNKLKVLTSLSESKNGNKPDNL
jgi:hypothetical protein